MYQTHQLKAKDLSQEFYIILRLTNTEQQLSKALVQRYFDETVRLQNIAKVVWDKPFII